MKNQLKLFLISTLVLCNFKLLSQKVNVEAKIVLKNDVEIQGTLKNRDWEESPLFIEFKSTDEKKYKKYIPEELKSFQTDDIKYISKEVVVDKASDDLQDLESEPRYDTLKTTVFLKQLVKGKVSLYEYNAHLSAMNYFVENEQGEIQRLVYKRFINGESKIQEVLKYKNQLSYYLFECAKSNEACEKVMYNEKALKNIITQFNQCVGSNAEIRKEEKLKYTLSFYGGLSYSHINYAGEDNLLMVGVNYKNATSYSFLISAGFPISKRFQKRQLVGELGMHKLKTGGIDSIGTNYGYGHVYDINIDMTYLKASILYRYHLKNDQHLKYWIDGGLSLGVAIQNKNYIKVLDNNVVFSNKGSIQSHEDVLCVGIGTSYKRVTSMIRYEIGFGPSVPGTRATIQTAYFLLGIKLF